MLKSPARTDSALWRERTTEVGWVLLPLRAFLGVTMIYAGLLKLFDPAYLDASSPNGVEQQMRAAAESSPIGFLVTFTADHAAVFGLAIAFGELAVGLGVLLGVWTRLAAAGGLLLSASFLLTVSWGTSPYFLGPDIVFLFAFTPLIIGGDGGVLSASTSIRNSTRRRMRLPVPPPVHERAQVAAEVDRRTLLRTGAVASVIGAGALLLGGLGRIVAGSSSGSVAQAAPPTAGSQPVEAIPETVPVSGRKPKGGVKIGRAADLAVGGVLAFTHPKTKEPANVLQPKKGTYLAYSAVCTHQGCTVSFDEGSDQFSCPCHGARFDGATGEAVRGPARDPLAKVQVVEANGNLYVV